MADGLVRRGTMPGLDKGLKVMAALQRQNSKKEEPEEPVWKDPASKLRQYLPPMTKEEEEELPQLSKIDVDIPHDEDGQAMVMLPYFEDDDDEQPGLLDSRQAILLHSKSKNFTFGSKAWDALFNAAMDARKEGTAEHAELEEFKREAEQRHNEKIVDELPLSSIYDLLNETPEETKKRLKNIRERHKRMATIHSSAQKTWMTKHGRVVRPKLPDAMRLQLQEAFDLIDQDGSGAIDVDELGEAFKVLGMKVSKKQVQAMMDEVDEDKSGEVELAEFEQIMAAQMMGVEEGGDNDDKEAGGGTAVPFHVIATSYRRKRLMDAIMTSDYEGLRSLVDKAIQFKELADKQRAQMIKEHLWLSTKVATRIRRFIRNWRKAKEIRDREKAMALAEERELARKQRIEEGREEESEDEEEFQQPRTAMWGRGERDMNNIKINNRRLDGRTLEKIRLRAKMSSIVAALEAKEMLEIQAFSAPIKRADNYYEAEDLTGLRKGLDSMFDISAKTKAEFYGKRMLLAANAHHKLPSTSKLANKQLVNPQDVKTGLTLTPRGKAAAVIERLSQGVRSKSPNASRLRSAAKRAKKLGRLSTPSASTDDLPSADIIAEHPREVRGGQIRAASCVPWLSEEKFDSRTSEHDPVLVMTQNLFHGTTPGKKRKPRRNLSKLSENTRNELLHIPRAASVEPPNVSVTYDHQHELSAGVVRQAPCSVLKQQQTVGLAGPVKRPEPLPMVQHVHMLASSTYETQPVRRAVHHGQQKMKGGRTSPTPFTAHLSGQLPGKVLPLLNEVPQQSSKVGMSPSPSTVTKKGRVSICPPISDKRSINNNRSGSRHPRKSHAGLGNGVTVGLARREGEPVVNVHPSYVVGHTAPRPIGPAVARHFVEAMMDVPRTPQARTRMPHSHGMDLDMDISSFPARPR